mmetsp:Transcript_55398/g.110024  ORF Transcript_55398/g.110024 Transcript_55398/m.110024 type:complete len:104 (-) Transcript_55398:223-534(-)
MPPSVPPAASPAADGQWGISAGLVAKVVMRHFQSSAVQRTHEEMHFFCAARCMAHEDALSLVLATWPKGAGFISVAIEGCAHDLPRVSFGKRLHAHVAPSILF